MKGRKDPGDRNDQEKLKNIPGLKGRKSLKSIPGLKNLKNPKGIPGLKDRKGRRNPPDMSGRKEQGVREDPENPKNMSGPPGRKGRKSLKNMSVPNVPGNRAVISGLTKSPFLKKLQRHVKWSAAKARTIHPIW